MIRTRMDMSSMTAEQREKAARWSKLGELGMEGALRQCGASEEVIDGLVSELQLTVADLDDSHVDWDVSRCDWGFIIRASRKSDKCVAWDLSKLEEDLDIDDAKCVFLAVLGRGAPLVKSLAVGQYQSSEEDIQCQVNIYFENLNEDELLALCVNLAANEHLREFCLLRAPIFCTEIGRSPLGNAFAANTSIRMVTDALEDWGSFGCEVLKVNNSVRFLRFYRPLRSEGIIKVAQLLKANTTLKSLDLGGASDHKTLESLSSCLTENVGLSQFVFLFGIRHSPLVGNLLLAPFIHDGSSDRKNTAIARLHIQFAYSIGAITAADLAAMIKTNKILKELSVSGLSLEPDEWAAQVLPALGQNETLTYLDLDRCRGLDEGSAYDAMMEVVQSSNTNLDNISLANTKLEAKEARLAEELRINKEYRLKLRGQPKQKPTTSRLVLCGYEFAGKTSIRKTAARVQRGIQMSSCQRVQLVLAKFLQNHPRLRQRLFGTNAVLESQYRTHGIEIVMLEENHMSVWDFAGQAEYYVLHDYLFPCSENSCFMYVCNVKGPPTSQNHGRREIMKREAMRDQFLYWLRFIVSNTKPVQGVSSGQKRLLHVIFVLTGKDTLGEAELCRSEEYAKDIVLKFKEEFQDVISLSQKVEIINAHSHEDVGKLLITVKNVLNEILGQSSEYIICADVRVQLRRWIRLNPSRPIVSHTDFKQQIWEKVRGYNTIEMHTVLAQLNDVGDVIYLKPLGFVVVNPSWFGVGILGSLINAFAGTETLDSKTANGLCMFGRSKPIKQNSWKLYHEYGFVLRGRIDELLEKSLQCMSQVVTSSDELVKLMIDLELCFQERPDDGGSRLFIPALFDETSDEDARKGLRKLKWEANFPPGERVHFIGRRLECKNKSLTFLTPGFFPRLQVVLRNFLHERKWTQNVGFRVASNLLGFVFNGMEVLVEYSGDIDYFVDILVRSSRSSKETLQFVKQNVIQKIREFCASTQGCQGVELVEAVMRPICVKELYLCAERVPHAVLVSDLDISMREGDGSSYRHTWSKRISNIHDDDLALDLLSGEGSYRRFIAANQIALSGGSSSSRAPGVSPDWLRNSGSQFSNGPDLPKRFFPTIEDLGFMTKLNARTNLAMVTPIKLHLMCDGLDGVDDPHEVEAQPGRTMKLNEKLGGKDFPILKYAVRILWAGAKIAASTVNISAEVTEIDAHVKRMSNSPVGQVSGQISVDMLRSIMQQSSASGRPAAHQKVPPEYILQYLKEYVRMDPSAQWLVDFLDLHDSKRFFEDFKLYKVRIKITKEIIWLCPDHYKRGIRDELVESVPLM